MDYRLDQCYACTQASQDIIEIQARIIDQLRIHCVAAETAIRHLLEEVDGDRIEAVAVEIDAVRRIAAEVERAHQDLAKLSWRS